MGCTWEWGLTPPPQTARLPEPQPKQSKSNLILEAKVI